MSILSDFSSGEVARLDSLYKYQLLDVPPSEAFDRMTRTVAQVFKLPIAAISLTDSNRQWFRSRVGVTENSIPRVKAPCAQVSHDSGMLVINDLLADRYYKDSYLAISGIRFYAGAPLVTNDGFCLGALCVLGTVPREITQSERDTLLDIAAMVMAQIELQHALGRIDSSSGLPNQIQFIEDFKDMSVDGPRGQKRLAALVNLTSPDQLGHALQSLEPSYLSKLVSEAIHTITKTCITGRLYHITATEFILIAPLGIDEIEFCARLHTWLDRHALSIRSRFVTTPRIGVLPFEVGVTHYSDLLRNLHSSVRHALEQDLNLSVFSAAQDAIYQRRFWLINEFGAVFDNLASRGAAELRLMYQPKIDMITGNCTGAEALLRWNHPKAGHVSPEEFIPIIEKTNIINAVTDWVLESTMQQIAAWRAEGCDLQVAINVSAVNLLEPNFCKRVVSGLHTHRVPPKNLILEITESALMHQPEVAHAVLDALVAAGISIAIDDFGTGYSSLSYLQNLPAEIPVSMPFARR
jgi:EAL domain-containing protein (putative c-di-GMP-specific phosphodiesterase class I)